MSIRLLYRHLRQHPYRVTVGLAVAASSFLTAVAVIGWRTGVWDGPLLWLATGLAAAACWLAGWAHVIRIRNRRADERAAAERPVPQGEVWGHSWADVDTMVLPEYIRPQRPIDEDRIRYEVWSKLTQRPPLDMDLPTGELPRRR